MSEWLPPCENCKLREFYKESYGMDFSADECLLQCEQYIRWKAAQRKVTREDGTKDEKAD